MDELRAISTFVRAAELGSFNKAALLQGTTPQAVSKTVRLLEQQLGVRLIHRTTRGGSLTDDGQRLFEAAKDSLSGLEEAFEQAKKSATGHDGVIRVSTPAVVGRRVLMPVVKAFRSLHAGISFDFAFDERAEQGASRVDVSFVMAPQLTTQVAARKLFPVRQVVCASPEYLERHLCPADPMALAEHACIGYRQLGTGRVLPWTFRGHGRRARIIGPIAVCCSDQETELQAVLSGVGIGCIGSITVARHLREGRLVPLLTDWMTEQTTLHLCYARLTSMPARVRLFIEFAIANLRDCKEFSLSPEELWDLSEGADLAPVERGKNVLAFAR